MKVDKTHRHDGIKIRSKRDWFFLSIGGHIYTWHLALGRFSIAFEAGAKKGVK